MINIIRKIIREVGITEEELNKFIVGYVEKTKNVVLDASQLLSIKELIENGMFNIRFAAKKYALLLNYQPYELINLKTGLIIISDIYEL